MQIGEIISDFGEMIADTFREMSKVQAVDKIKIISLTCNNPECNHNDVNIKITWAEALRVPKDDSLIELKHLEKLMPLFKNYDNETHFAINDETENENVYTGYYISRENQADLELEIEILKKSIHYAAAIEPKIKKIKTSHNDL